MWRYAKNVLCCPEIKNVFSSARWSNMPRAKCLFFHSFTNAAANKKPSVENVLRSGVYQFQVRVVCVFCLRFISSHNSRTSRELKIYPSKLFGEAFASSLIKTVRNPNCCLKKSSRERDCVLVWYIHTSVHPCI